MTCLKIINIENKTLQIQVKSAPEENTLKQKSIAKFWQRQQEMNDALYNGTTFLMDNEVSRITDEEISLSVYETEYMNYFYNVKMENSSHSLRAAILVITSDEKIVLGVQDETDSFHFIGSAYDIADIESSNIQPQRAVERMLFEQLPLRYSDVEEIKPMLLIQNTTEEIRLVYITHVNTTSEKIKHDYATMKMKEFDGVYFLPLEQKKLIDFAFSNVQCDYYVKPAIEYFYKTLITKE